MCQCGFSDTSMWTGDRSDVESGGGGSRMAAYGLIGGKNRIAGT